MNKKNHRSFGYTRKLQSKQYQASYVGPDGRRYYAPKPFVAKSDADGFLAMEQTAINHGAWTMPAERRKVATESSRVELTLREIFPKFLAMRTTRSVSP